jgi:hypothetical protein
MTHRHALQGFLGTNHVSLHKKTSTCVAVAAGSREVTVRFNFISVHTVASISNGTMLYCRKCTSLAKLQIGEVNTLIG